MERIIKADLPRNLEAIAVRAEKKIKLLPKSGDPDSGLQTDIKAGLLGRLATQAGMGFRNLSVGWGSGAGREEGVGARQKAEGGGVLPSVTEVRGVSSPQPQNDRVYVQPVDSTAQLGWDGEGRGWQVDEVHLRRLDDNQVQWKILEICFLKTYNICRLHIISDAFLLLPSS